MKHRLLTLLALGLALFVPLQGFAGEEREDVVIVIMQNMAFVPQEVTIKVGQTVRWENHERRQFHNVWFKELGEDPVPYMFPEDFHEKTFNEPGVFPYVCQPHESRGMTGVITVTE